MRDGTKPRQEVPVRMWDVIGFTRPLDVGDVARAAGALVLGTLVGYAVYRVLRHRVRRDVTITGLGGEDIMLAALRDLALLWFTAAGAYLASRMLPLAPDVAVFSDRVLLAITILSGTWVAARTAGYAIKITSLRSGTHGRGSSILLNVTRVGIALVGFLILLQTIGVKVTPLLAALGIGGLAIALALKEPLANFFDGLQLLATRKVRPGQYVRLDSGEEGFIHDIDWRHASIKQLPDNMILVPNARLADAIVTNYDYPDPEMSLLVDVRVDYASDLEHVERVTIEVGEQVMEEVDGAVPGSQPFIRFRAFGDFGIDFTVIMRIRHVVDQHLVRHEFIKRLKRRYLEERIEIPYPTVSLNDLREDGAGRRSDQRGGFARR